MEEILARTDPTIIRNLYSLPEFANPLEFLTMLALTSGRLHKVLPIPSLLSVTDSWNATHRAAHPTS